MRSFFTKIAASAAPEGIGIPKDAAEWEQRILTAPIARRLTNRESPKTRKVEYPERGDQLYIYVHPTLGGSGLAAIATVSDAKPINDGLCQLKLMNVELLKRPWLQFVGKDTHRQFVRGTSKIPATGFLRHPHEYRPDRTLEMDDANVDDLVTTLARLNDTSLIRDQNGRVLVRSAAPERVAPPRRAESTNDSISPSSSVDNTLPNVPMRGVEPLDELDIETPEDHGLEGVMKLKYTCHRQRERALRDKKIKAALLEGGGRLRCQVPRCGFDFLEKYGELGKEFAHVHHLEPIASYPEDGRKVEFDELAIVCPNCHAMIHRGGQCRELDALIPE
ncbi:HNH endonuclease [Bradyrhizobium sp. Pear77]|uniref:HNH endonuclease n=1 Tax=Bradyrhizobium altum TaxID=1571202 RepID=UPI00289DA981|nr:HNH endonuclease [Bradyrhizobium altum]MCC8953134.1 HNH endonuclease [Bradyrhizobium altum]